MLQFLSLIGMFKTQFLKIMEKKSCSSFNFKIFWLPFALAAKSIIIHEQETGEGEEWPSICHICHSQCNNFNSKVLGKHPLSQFA